MGETLQETPTWVIAIICAVFIAISLLVERTIFYIGKWLKEHNYSSLYEALQKITEDFVTVNFITLVNSKILELSCVCDELMLLGFVSLFLTMAQNYVAKICIPKAASRMMLPCETKSSEDVATGSCTAEGTVPFVPLEGLRQLHILIFIMAISHVIYSVVTMSLGRWQVVRWRLWEDETKTEEYQSTHGTKSYKHTRQSSFIMKHTTSFWSQYTIPRYIAAFFLQFTGSVNRTDYLTLRHGFIKNHLNENAQFDFHNYILRCLEDDFQYVVGISPILWMVLILFVLMNVYGWKTYLWISILPLFMVLVVGAKLRHIITKLAFEITKRHTVIQGMPIVKLRNELFWFDKPKLVLLFIHFILFQNAFELAYYSWALVTFGMESCFHEDLYLLLGRFSIGLLVQIICSYITLPLYALVTQMGSDLKRSIFDDHVRDALESWRKRAQMRVPGKVSEAVHDLYHHNVVRQDNNGSKNIKDLVNESNMYKHYENFEEIPPNAHNGESSKQHSAIHKIISSSKHNDYIKFAEEM